MSIGDIIHHVLDEFHPAVRSGHASDGDTVPVLVTHVSEDGAATGTAFHPDGTTSVVNIASPETDPVPDPIVPVQNESA